MPQLKIFTFETNSPISTAIYFFIFVVDEMLDNSTSVSPQNLYTQGKEFVHIKEN